MLILNVVLIRFPTRLVEYDVKRICFVQCHA